MAISTYIFALLCLLAMISGARSVRCWECNVWKAGYGHMCDNPKIRENCKVCMKVETDSYIMRYSDTPKHSKTISQVCGNYDMTHFGVECHYYSSSDGTSKRCYCDTDLCNGAVSGPRPPTLLNLPLAVFIALCLILR